MEFKMALHQGQQYRDWIYLIYLQLEKPQPNDLFAPKWYESYSCAIRYNSASLALVDNSNVWFYGYKGNSLLAYASGVHTQINKDEIVDDHPYVISLEKEKTYVVTDVANKDYQEVCTFVRDFKTIWSEIPLKAGTTYQYTAGFKVYKSTGFASPTANGFNNALTFMVEFDGAARIVASVGAMAALIT